MRKIVLVLIALIPLCYLALHVQNANDPIKYIYTLTGFSALVFLLSCICLSPLKKLYNLMIYRKTLGLLALFYALLHFVNFLVLDAQFELSFVIKEALDKPFIYLGVFALLILIFMGFTSTKKLFAKFHKWHKLVYIALVLVLIHEIMAQKTMTNLEYFFIVFGIILLLQKFLYLTNMRYKF
ncbi:MAG: ferric reductase-like transmembrane domain-containing protein [Sulfurospirillum sp.]|nr:ferric reductase-like transmembrane domain-containing protein [Sulfurospirillum sp.]